ncbi:MAG: ferritin-like domain-containing protein [Acidimicrobiales bacterium]
MIRRNKRNGEIIAISEAEILRNTAELQDLHNDQSMPALRSSVEDWIEINHERARVGEAHTPQSGTVSRRNLLIGGGAAAIGGVLLAACSSSSSSTTTTAPVKTGTVGTGISSLTGDLKVAALAASLENLGIFAYKSGIAAATAGKLGSVPPAIVTFATTAMSQHEQHASAWNGALVAAGKGKVTETDPALTPTVKQMFAQVTDVGGLAKLALEIETIAAQTYQGAIGALSSKSAIETAATIHPVEMQHAAILNLVLGNYPVPNAFNPTSMARSTSDLGS